jgi:type III secretion system YscJ/HrcJ family lipoprotein
MSHPSRFILLSLALLLTGCGDTTELVVVNSEKEANRIIVELEQRGIAEIKSARQTRDRKPVFTVTVPRSAESAARQILVQLDLPREERGGLEQMVNSAGLIPTRSDERARLMYAIAGELEKTFETYDRVVRARVHVVIPDTDMSLSADPTKGPKPTATVVIKYSVPPAPELPKDATDEDKARIKATVEADSKPPLTSEDVAKLAARSVEGLDEKSVFVTYTMTTVQLTKAQAAAVEGQADKPATGPLGLPSIADNQLLYKMFAAVAVLSLLCIFLIYKLVKKGRKPA